jgi:hypothetical protein
MLLHLLLESKILKKEDDNYSYVVHTTEPNSINRLYFTNTDNNFKKDKFGMFNYSVFADEKFGKKKWVIGNIWGLSK